MSLMQRNRTPTDARFRAVNLPPMHAQWGNKCPTACAAVCAMKLDSCCCTSLPAELPIRLKIPSDCRLPELGPEHGTCKVRAGSQVVAVTI